VNRNFTELFVLKFHPLDYSGIPSPAFVLDEKLLRLNLELIDSVQKQAGIDIILAFKGFAMWSTFPLVRKYLNGATASSLFVILRVPALQFTHAVPALGE